MSRAVTIFVALVLWPELASAHVKWFVTYDLLCPPRPPFRVLFSDYFRSFCLFVAPLMFLVAYLDRYLARNGGRFHDTLQAASDRLTPYFPATLRLGVSAFFAVVFVYSWTAGSVILTPDLRTDAPWVRWLQLALAVFALSPRTAFLTGGGIAILYAYAVSVYGGFHMLDYPIFLGVAAYLILHSLYGARHARLAHNIMRIATGVTLLWASVEKWAYPEWSFMLLTERPGLTFGFNPEFYMVAAGFVEFCAAFLIITGMLSARASAIILLVFFLSAIESFGMIDAIGHSLIIIVLVLLTLSSNPIALRFDRPQSLRATAFAHTGIFFGALAAFMALYYGGHYLSFQL